MNVYVNYVYTYVYIMFGMSKKLQNYRARCTESQSLLKATIIFNLIYNLSIFSTF